MMAAPDLATNYLNPDKGDKDHVGIIKFISQNKY